MRIRLLIDAYITEDGVSRLQGLLGEQPVTAVLIEGFPSGIDGRFMGANLVEENHNESSQTG
jgi:hypothetical protein